MEYICLRLEHILLTAVPKRKLKRLTIEQMVRKGFSEEVIFHMRSSDHMRQTTLIRIHQMPRNGLLNKLIFFKISVSD